MADGINPIVPVGNTYTQKGMTLPEIMQMARSVQEYKQAQQMNPISLSTAQAQSERARIEADVAKGTSQADIAKSLASSKKETETVEPYIARAKAESGTAQIGQQKAQLGLSQDYLHVMRNNQISLINHPTVIKAEQDPKFAEEHKDELHSLIAQQSKLAQAGGMDEDKANALNAPYHLAVGQGLRQFLKTQFVSGLDAQAQASVTQPTGVTVNTGAGGATISTNQYSANQPGTPLPGTEFKTQLPPTTQVYNPNTKQMEFISPTQQNTPKNIGAEAPIGVTQLATINASNFGEYQKNLINKVDADNQVVQRTAEMKDLLSEFKPGAGSETRMDIAKKLQAFGAPTTLVDSIARGDLSAGQSFNKFIAQMVSSAAHQAGGTGAGVGEIDNYIKNNPDINTDPRALNRFIGFVEKQSARDRFELNALSEAQKNPNFKPENWINDYSKLAIKAGVMPRPVNPAGTTTQNKNAPNQRTVVRSGTIVQGKKTLRVTEYSDGTQDIKEAK